MKKLTHTLILLSAIAWTKHLQAQSVTSPYSVLGIGDIESKDFGRYFASGNAATARRDMEAANFSNPAGLTALPLKTLHFDITMRGRSSRFRTIDTDTSTFPSNDFTIKRISLAFKVSPKYAIGAGLRPYSSVNYMYISNTNITDGAGSFTKLTDGNGGINQAYLSIAREVGKHFSAGFTASWLFGTINRKTTYFGNEVALLVDKQETDSYNGFSLQGGLQYYTKNSKKWQHKIGLTATANTPLKGWLSATYYENDTTIATNESFDRKFELPLGTSFGYAATFKNKLTLSVDAAYNFWARQKVNYNRSYTDPNYRFAAGIEYSKKKKGYTGTFEKFYVAAGFSMETSYIKLQNNPINDFTISFGGGLHVNRSFTWFTGIEAGNRGSLQLSQIRENYTQFVFGITIKDIWAGPKYAKRYD